jgi:hypothetical protein
VTCRSLLLAAFFWTVLAAFAQARELQSGEGTTGGQTSSSQSKPTPSDPKAFGQDPPVEMKHDGQESFIVAPLPISGPALGAGIVPVFAYIFHLSPHDKTSPPSVVGGAGLVTNNGSRAFVLAGDLFFHEDTYHATAAYAHGNLNYDLYGVGIDAGKAGIKLPLNQTGQFFFAEFSRRVGWEFFLGTRVFMGGSTITIRPSDASTIPPPSDVGLRTNLRSLGLLLRRDTRPNRFYPTTGTFLDFTADFFSQGLGSKYSYQSYKFTFNRFASLSQKQVLAFDCGFCGTGGKPPFYGNCIYGTNNQLRGYTAGRYLDRYIARDSIGVPSCFAQAVRFGWVWRIRRRGSGRRSTIQGKPFPSERLGRHKVSIEQEISRKSSCRRWLRKRRPHMEHGSR